MSYHSPDFFNAVLQPSSWLPLVPISGAWLLLPPVPAPIAPRASGVPVRVCALYIGTGWCSGTAGCSYLCTRTACCPWQWQGAVRVTLRAVRGSILHMLDLPLTQVHHVEGVGILALASSQSLSFLLVFWTQGSWRKNQRCNFRTCSTISMHHPWPGYWWFALTNVGVVALVGVPLLPPRPLPFTHRGFPCPLHFEELPAANLRAIKVNHNRSFGCLCCPWPFPQEMHATPILDTCMQGPFCKTQKVEGMR